MLTCETNHIPEIDLYIQNMYKTSNLNILAKDKYFKKTFFVDNIDIAYIFFAHYF